MSKIVIESLEFVAGFALILLAPPAKVFLSYRAATTYAVLFSIWALTQIFTHVQVSTG